MIEIKNGKIVMNAVVTGITEAGEPSVLSIGDMIFDRRRVVSKDLTLSPLKTKRLSRGKHVAKISSTWILKNVLDECKTAKTWNEIEGVVKRFYLNCNDETIKTYTKAYTIAVQKGIPSVPFDKLAKRIKMTSVVRAKGKVRPDGALYFDKSCKCWVRSVYYDMVKEHVMALDRFILKDVTLLFSGKIKYYIISSIIRRFVQEGIVRKHSGGSNIWYYTVVKQVPVAGHLEPVSDHLDDIVN